MKAVGIRVLKKRFAAGALGAAIAFALPIGGSVALTASPAAAATLKIKCNSMASIGIPSTQIKLGQCDGNTGHTSFRTPASTLFTGGTFPWKNGKTTSIRSSTTGTGTLCPLLIDEQDLTIKAEVIGDTTGSVTVGSNAKAEICIGGAGDISLAPGTQFKI